MMKKPLGKISGKPAGGIALAALVLLALLYLLQLLLLPKYMGAVREGALVAEYYRETTPHDVIFIGDCEVYENFSPITLWENYGITSFIRGTPQQLIWQSYYLLEETLRYETPKVVVFNVLSMKFAEPQNEAYNRMTLDGMRLSPIKIQSARASMTKGESLSSYLVPFLRFHSRWSDLNLDDFKYMFQRQPVSHNGYLMRVDTKPATQLPTPPILADDDFSEVCYQYLDRMTRLCKEKGIELVLVKAPSIYPHWYEEWDRQMADYAQREGLWYVNFLDSMEECGIDMQTDTYDSGLHLNLSGAEKLSRYFGQELQRRCQLADHRTDTRLAAIWNKKAESYYNEKALQEAELSRYGYLKSLKLQEEKK